ncbi:MAG TPA: TauD/TfdA family dioxygenase [Candidatus Angelobacter sp.]|nr:TauD/TfdA family dioxygenase [Candidatus Angelobacter sp.]
MTNAKSPAMRVVPLGGPLGADIEGVDLSREIGDETLAAILEAWARHLVLRFRGQRLDEDGLMAFSARFGSLDRAPVNTAATRPHANPFVLLVSNVVEDGRPIGSLGAYESQWHADMSYNPQPPAGSFLYAVEVPPDGGDTGFLNLYRACETLPVDLKAAIDGRVCTHDSSLNSAGELRAGNEEVTDPRRAPGAVHPLVRAHPVTGRPVLYLGRRRNAYIHGLPLAESEALLDRLWAHAMAAEHGWYQRWRVGDLVLWDNFATVHRRDSFDPGSRRLMLRTQIGARGNAGSEAAGPAPVPSGVRANPG